MKLLPQPHKTGFYVKGIVSERGMAVVGGVHGEKKRSCIGQTAWNLIWVFHIGNKALGASSTHPPKAFVGGCIGNRAARIQINTQGFQMPIL